MKQIKYLTPAENAFEKREKEYLKMKARAKRMQEKRRPVKGYTKDTLARNLFKVFIELFPEGAPSSTISEYAIQKTNSLPIYRQV